MQYIKYCVSAFSICLLLSCAQLSKTPSRGKAEPQIDVPASSSEESAAIDAGAPFVAIPKPQAVNKTSVPPQARAEFDEAKKAMRAGKWQRAEDILLLMTNTYPELAGVYTNLGIVYSKREQLDEAENAYRFAIKTNPLNFDAYTNLGILLREQGKFEAAEQNYLAALAQWPHHQASLLNLGVLYDLYLDKLAQALDYYRLAQKLNEKEDRQLKGWIIDLERRLQAQK